MGNGFKAKPKKNIYIFFTASGYGPDQPVGFIEERGVPAHLSHWSYFGGKVIEEQDSYNNPMLPFPIFADFRSVIEFLK